MDEWFGIDLFFFHLVWEANTAKIVVKCMGKVKTSMPSKLRVIDFFEYLRNTFKEKIPRRFFGQI